jgi:hypothetical protein
MKPRVKNDSWCYTATNRSAREKVKRLSSKRHRREDKKIINGEAWASPYRYISKDRKYIWKYTVGGDRA